MQATLRGIVLGLALAPACFSIAAAQTGSLQANFNADAPVRGRPVMVSVIQGGAVVAQSETVLPSAHSFSDLPFGTYDVRVEGDGLITEVKRGVQVGEHNRLELHFVMRPGQGAHIVAYATGGLSREEVAARLARLDSAVAALQRAASAGAGRPN